MRKRVWIAGVAVALIGTAAAFTWWKTRPETNPAALLRRLPSEHAVLAGINFDALRAGGFLSIVDQSKAPEEQEYRTFVQDTGFDYRTDLDSVLASFAPQGEFFLARGKFDWKRIGNYISAHGGSGTSQLYEMKGSSASREISLFKLSRDVLALAVSADPRAAERLRSTQDGPDFAPPTQPIWLTADGGALGRASGFSGASTILSSALADATRVTMTADAAGSNISARFDAIFSNPEQAGRLAGQINQFLGLLRQQAADGPTPLRDPLGATLLNGEFNQSGTHVFGSWQISRSVVEEIAKGL